MARAKKPAEPRRLRCSALPLIMRCGPAAQSPEVRVESSGPEAALGSAVHAVLAKCLMDGLEQPPDLDPYAARYGLDDAARDDLRSLTWAGLNAWKELRGEVELRAVEAELDPVDIGGIMLTGHADILGEWDRGPLVIDYKSGWRDADYSDQVRGYALLAMEGRTVWEVAKARIVWLRECRVENMDLTHTDLADWTARLLKQLDSTAYSPGEHCTYCARRLECPGRLQLVRSALRELSPDGAAGQGALSAVALASLYPRVKVIEKAIEAYMSALREAVAAEGAPVPIGDGRALSLEVQKRETCLPLRSLNDLSLHLDMPSAELLGALADAVTCPKKALEDLAAGRANRGAKTAARSEVIDLLRGVDALRVTEFRRLTATKER